MWIRLGYCLIIAGTFLVPCMADEVQPSAAAVVELRLAQDSPGDQLTKASVVDGDQIVYLHPTVITSSQDVSSAAVVSDSDGHPTISVTFNEEGAKKIAEVTTEHRGKRIAIVVDDKVISAPRILATIQSRAQITGNFTIQEAVRIADSLNMSSEDGATDASETAPGQFVELFNGRDLSGWVNVNTDPDTWYVQDGLLVCRGLPIGVMRSEKQYENFILHIEWRHMKPGGNSGVFVWSEGVVPEGRQLPKGMEVQMLELDWVNQHRRADGQPQHIGYVSGELFGAGGLNATPDNPRGRRSMAWELRCNGAGQWNVYDVVCVDGTVKLSINGKFVNSIRDSEVRKGYLCLESEGSEIHFRNIRILELPPGLTTAAQTAKVIE